MVAIWKCRLTNEIYILCVHVYSPAPNPHLTYSFTFHSSFSSPRLTMVWEQMLLPLMNPQKVNSKPNTMSLFLRHSPHFISSSRHFNISHLHKKMDEGRLRGSVGWVTSSWFGLGSWSRGCGIGPPMELCARRGVGFLFSLSLWPSPLLSPSLSQINKKIFFKKKLKKKDGWVQYSKIFWQRLIIFPFYYSIWL